MKINLYSLIIILSFVVLPCHVWSNDYFAKGKVASAFYQVNYSKDSHRITIIMRDEVYNFELTGYDATNFYIGDINHDGNDEVVFLDLSGVSVGGELRILIWNGKSFEEVQDEYFASVIRVDRIKNHYYILLVQHDTQDLFYVSDVLELDKMSLNPSRVASVWKKIISDYIKQMNRKIEDWKKSRYHAYIAIAYKIIGDGKKTKYHFNRARQIDKHNPLLEKIDNTDGTIQ